MCAVRFKVIHSWCETYQAKPFENKKRNEADRKTVQLWRQAYNMFELRCVLNNSSQRSFKANKSRTQIPEDKSFKNMFCCGSYSFSCIKSNKRYEMALLENEDICQHRISFIFSRQLSDPFESDISVVLLVTEF